MMGSLDSISSKGPFQTTWLLKWAGASRNVGRGLHQKLGDWLLSSRDPMALVLNVPSFGSH
ncbi:hypothetical protein [Synechococcus sp. MIT S1220]|uniref:hypothetical protein n=1 Tax=Synechococcus sp. MIT S1220 TaxID=3082549 RepID=UPI0039B01C2B